MFGSSRTQRTVSLSSCEAELHGMVSTLADGIDIRRCLSFLTGADVSHYLLTDSSSARQLASKQSVGKVRHLDGKILWIQQHVLSGDVFLQQLPTAWNVADLCTKALPQQRVKILLHELGVCKDNGLTIIGQLEHDEQVEKHGSRRQIMQLAKSLMRVATVMGLGSRGANGYVLSGELEESTCAIGPVDQCSAAATATMMEDSKILNLVCIFLVVATWVIFGCAGYWFYRKWKRGMTIMEEQHYLLSRPSSCRTGHGLFRLQWAIDPYRVWLGRNCERSGFPSRLCQQHTLWAGRDGGIPEVQ